LAAAGLIRQGSRAAWDLELFLERQGGGQRMARGVAMAEEDDTLTRLMSATEADVETVLERSRLGGNIELVSTEVLLLFFQSMLSELLT
jgi:hypothetical protein